MRKKFTVFICILSIIIAATIGFFIWLNKEKIYAINAIRFYYKNKETLNDISDYFSRLYEPSLHSISYSSRTNEFMMRFIDGNQSVYYDDSIQYKMSAISESYMKNADYGCFYDVWAKYDKSGDMQLVIALKDKRLKGSQGEDERVIGYFLIYADDEYDGAEFHAFNHYDEKPVDGNWYYWWTKTYPG